MLCVPVFSSISSPGMMDLQKEVLVAFRQSDHIVQPSRPAGAIIVGKNFNHSGGSISVEGSSASSGGAVLESFSGVAGDGSRCLW